MIDTAKLNNFAKEYHVDKSVELKNSLQYYDNYINLDLSEYI